MSAVRGRTLAACALVVAAALAATLPGPPAIAHEAGRPEARWESHAGAFSADAAEHPAGRPLLRNVTGEAGIRWMHAGFIGTEDVVANFPESASGGACWLDYDSDGRLDLYLVNGLYVTDLAKNDEWDPRSALFRNLGNGAFENVSAAAGVALRGLYMGCSAADYDDDADTDLFVNGFGVRTLFRNDGGVFTNVTAAAGVDGLECDDEFPCWGTSSSWLDYDRDGCLDLLMDMFVSWDLTNPTSFIDGDPQMMKLFRSNCDGTFTDRTVAAGVTSLAPHWSSVSAHLNADEWPDVYVSNDGTPNDLYLNNGDGTFRRPLSSADNGGRNGMGTDVADINNDGRMDIVTTNFVSQTNGIYVQRPDLEYDDVGVDPPFDDARPFSGWAARFTDLQNDGRPDLVLVNGMTQFVSRDDPPEEPMLAYEQHPDGTWTSVRNSLGWDFREELLARGAAWADYDDDGDVDMVVVETAENPAHLFRQELTPGNFVNVALVGDAVTGTRDAIGARVTVTAAGVPLQIQDRIAGAGLLGSNDPRLHFGLGIAESATITVRWPDGATQTFGDVRANTFVRITQGEAAPEVLRELPIVRISGPDVLRRLQTGTFHATVVDSAAPIASIVWTFDDGRVGSGATETHAWRDVGTFHLRARATDALGNAKTQSFEVRVWDTLTVDVDWDHPAFLPTEPATGEAVVRFSNGDRVPFASLSLEVSYTSGSAEADAAVGALPKFARTTAGYVTKWVNGTTDFFGRFDVEAPWWVTSPSHVVEAEANQPGRYAVTVTGGARGSVVAPEETEYRVLARVPT